MMRTTGWCCCAETVRTHRHHRIAVLLSEPLSDTRPACTGLRWPARSEERPCPRTRNPSRRRRRDDPSTNRSALRTDPPAGIQAHSAGPGQDIIGRQHLRSHAPPPAPSPESDSSPGRVRCPSTCHRTSPVGSGTLSVGPAPVSPLSTCESQAKRESKPNVRCVCIPAPYLSHRIGTRCSTTPRARASVLQTSREVAQGSHRSEGAQLRNPGYVLLCAPVLVFSPPEADTGPADLARP
ncbi:hypothetical protein BC628DRAFT_1398129 [Trametes gibbosa]|nr:hypothetical protein BC628DRAFT_1398129 [Trametes gibbosa]